jgi:ABC-type bacteriocin/lantibiotic exporter with double-glycine peptidase domain
LGLIVHFGSVISTNTVQTISAIANEIRYSVSGYPITDGIAPAFRQTSENSCGASAIAYLLTLLGDFVFEHDVLRDLKIDKSHSLSFLDMREYLKSRGLQGLGYRGNYNDIVAEQIPLIAHLNYGHFVIVLHATKNVAFIFDPASGRRVAISREKFLQIWSGNFMVIRPTAT